MVERERRDNPDADLVPVPVITIFCHNSYDHFREQRPAVGVLHKSTQWRDNGDQRWEEVEESQRVWGPDLPICALCAEKYIKVEPSGFYISSMTIVYLPW